MSDLPSAAQREEWKRLADEGIAKWEKFQAAGYSFNCFNGEIRQNRAIVALLRALEAVEKELDLYRRAFEQTATDLIDKDCEVRAMTRPSSRQVWPK